MVALGIRAQYSRRLGPGLRCETRRERVAEPRRGPQRRQVPREEQRRPDGRIVGRAPAAFVGVRTHRDAQRFTEGTVEPREMPGAESGAMHREGVGETRVRSWGG